MPNNNHNPILRQAMRLVLLYLALVLAGTLAKPLFVLAQPAAVSGSTGWSGIGQAMLHGLLLDVATAGYLIAPVWLLCGLGLWVRLRGWRVAYKVWAAVVGAALALVLVGDACLYGFWHTKLDATVWNYLAQPEGALQSVSMGYACAPHWPWWPWRCCSITCRCSPLCHAARLHTRPTAREPHAAQGGGGPLRGSWPAD